MSSRLRLAFILVVSAQVVFLLAFIGVREYTLRRGTEVLLQTVPVDPRDLFRGDYVVLRYTISTVSHRYPYFDTGDRVYVRISPRNDGVWQAAEIEDTPGPQSADSIWIRGKVERVDGRGSSDGRVFVSYQTREKPTKGQESRLEQFRGAPFGLKI